jgi:hypothetical protein
MEAQISVNFHQTERDHATEDDTVHIHLYERRGQGYMQSVWWKTSFGNVRFVDQERGEIIVF